MILTVNKAKLTAECWGVQFNGLEACNECEFKGTKECGGKKIVKTGKNEKGFKVPISEDLNETLN